MRRSASSRDAGARANRRSASLRALPSLPEFDERLAESAAVDAAPALRLADRAAKIVCGLVVGEAEPPAQIGDEIVDVAAATAERSIQRRRSSRFAISASSASPIC